MIRYDTQAAHRGITPRTELIRAANRMSRPIDPRRPKGVTDKQREKLYWEAEIKELCYRQDQLCKSIRWAFGFVIPRWPKENLFPTSIRKSNAMWDGLSKHKSGLSRSRYKHRTTLWPRYKTFARSWRETRSRWIRFVPTQDLFSTRLQNDLASPRSPSPPLHSP